MKKGPVTLPFFAPILPYWISLNSSVKIETFGIKNLQTALFFCIFAVGNRMTWITRKTP